MRRATLYVAGLFLATGAGLAVSAPAMAGERSDSSYSSSHSSGHHQQSRDHRHRWWDNDKSRDNRHRWWDKDNDHRGSNDSWRCRHHQHRSDYWKNWD